MPRLQRRSASATRAGDRKETIMPFMHRSRRELSIIATALIFCSVLLTPARAEYNPKLGRFMQRDPNQTALVLSEAGSDRARTQVPHAAVSAPGQYQDGMNFLLAFGANPINHLDPTGLSFADEIINLIKDNFWLYQLTDMGRAWTRRFESLQQDPSLFLGDISSAFDEDVNVALQAYLNSRAAHLGGVEQAAVVLYAGYKRIQNYQAAAFAWDNLVWEESEGALFSMILGPFGSTICFAEGTPVLMADGSSTEIQNIRTGDRVLSLTVPKGEVVASTVSATFRRPVHQLLLIAVDGEEIACTSEHPFWVVGVGWVAACELERGDALRTASGTVKLVTDCHAISHSAVVYNFTVRGTHTYFVGRAALLVHNRCTDFYKRARSFLERIGLEGVVKVHHIITKESYKHFKQFFDEIGFYINHINNLKFSRTPHYNDELHRAYNAVVESRVSRIYKLYQAGRYDAAQALEAIIELQRGLRKELLPNGTWRGLIDEVN
jgi:hypothetical protein